MPSTSARKGETGRPKKETAENAEHAGSLRRECALHVWRGIDGADESAPSSAFSASSAVQKSPRSCIRCGMERLFLHGTFESALASWKTSSRIEFWIPSRPTPHPQHYASYPRNKHLNLRSKSAKRPLKLRSGLRSAPAQSFTRLHAAFDLNHLLPGFLPGDPGSQQRLPKLKRKLQILCSL